MSFRWSKQFLISILLIIYFLKIVTDFQRTFSQRYRKLSHLINLHNNSINRNGGHFYRLLNLASPNYPIITGFSELFSVYFSLSLELFHEIIKTSLGKFQSLEFFFRILKKMNSIRYFFSIPSLQLNQNTEQTNYRRIVFEVLEFTAETKHLQKWISALSELANSLILSLYFRQTK